MAMTIREIMQEYGVSRESIFGIIKNGRLKARKFYKGKTGRWLVNKTDYEEYRRGRYKQPRKVNGEELFNKSKGIYSVNDAAEYCNCSPQRIYYQCRIGKIDAKRVGCTYVISKFELDLFKERDGFKKKYPTKELQRLMS